MAISFKLRALDNNSTLRGTVQTTLRGNVVSDTGIVVIKSRSTVVMPVRLPNVIRTGR